MHQIFGAITDGVKNDLSEHEYVKVTGLLLRCPFVAEGKVCPMDSNPFQRRVFNHIPRVGRLGGLEKVLYEMCQTHCLLMMQMWKGP